MDTPPAPIRRFLTTRVAGTFAIQMAATGLTFAVNLLFARCLDAAGFGTYAYAMSWVYLLTVVGLMGLDRFALRETAMLHADDDFGSIASLRRTSVRQAVLWSGLTSLAAIGVAVATGAAISLLLAICIVPLIVLLRINQSTLRGMQHILVGQFPEHVCRPLLAIVTFIAIALLGGEAADPLMAVTAQFVAALVAVVMGCVWIRRILGNVPPQRERGTTTWAQMQILIPLMVVGVLQSSQRQLDVIVLGTLASAEVTGVFAVCQRFALLVGCPLVAANFVLASTVPRFYAARDFRKIQLAALKGSRRIALGSAAIAVALLVLGPWLLGWFGNEFSQGYAPMCLLVAGEIVNGVIGFAGVLLLMTCHERIAMLSIGAGVFAKVCLLTLLVPLMGVMGAAIASVASMVCMNVLMAIAVYRYLGIDGTAFGFFAGKALRHLSPPHTDVGRTSNDLKTTADPS